MERQVGEDPDGHTERSAHRIPVGNRQPLWFCKWGVMFGFIHLSPKTNT